RPFAQSAGAQGEAGHDGAVARVRPSAAGPGDADPESVSSRRLDSDRLAGDDRKCRGVGPRCGCCDRRALGRFEASGVRLMASRIALVTGANGFVGCYVVRALVARGTTVRAFVRKGADLRALA